MSIAIFLLEKNLFAGGPLKGPSAKIDLRKRFP